MAGRRSVRCAVADDARAMAARALGGEYVLVHNGIAVERFAKATPWPTAGPTLFFVGRHEPRKGLTVLLEALTRLPSDLTLWIGRDAPDTDELRARAGGDPRGQWLVRLGAAELARRPRGA